MCTLSWKAIDSEYVLFFNRDEQRSRLPALPPTLQQRNGVMFMSPTDPHHQGTWLLVNEHALTICLLNHYPMTAMPYSPNPPSRGMLPLICADCSGVDEAMHRLLATPLMSYMPFRFVTISPTQATQAIWDGLSIKTSALPHAGGMLTSSSYHSNTVEQLRHATFRNMVGPIEGASIETLNDFHHHSGADESSGICMSRPDACTHSITRITVSNQSRSAGLHYEPLVYAKSDESPRSLSDLSDRSEQGGRARQFFRSFEENSRSYLTKRIGKMDRSPTGAVDQSQVRQAPSTLDLPLKPPRKLHEHRNTSFQSTD